MAGILLKGRIQQAARRVEALPAVGADDGRVGAAIVEVPELIVSAVAAELIDGITVAQSAPGYVEALGVAVAQPEPDALGGDGAQVRRDREPVAQRLAGDFGV